MCEENQLDELRQVIALFFIVKGSLQIKHKGVTKMHAKYREEYLHLLKKFDRYAAETKVCLEFKYQSMDDVNLTQIREQFGLENIAGNGDEISKIMNLFHWLNQTIFHDGSQIYNGESNAIAIINSVKEGNSVNCRMVSIAMNEVFLAMGFHSKAVTCMPIGFDFKDCHVVNIVYSHTLDKWIFLDASLGVYFKDKNGALLSLEELREAVISNSEIYINEAVYEGKIVEQDDYLTYMTKNLFQFACYANYEYNFESKNGEKTLYYLNPVDYFPTSCKTMSQEWRGNMINEQYIDCAKEFWKKP